MRKRNRRPAPRRTGPSSAEFPKPRGRQGAAPISAQVFSEESIGDFGIANAVDVGETGRQAYFASTAGGDLNLVVIPEPGTAALLAVFAGVAAVMRRRLRR